MRRLLAIVAAVGMVTVAVLIRGVLDDDDGDDANGEALVVVCASDLREACAALGGAAQVRIQEPADTTTALADGSLEDDVDAWITSTAWLEVAESRAPERLGEARAIAASAATVATAPDRYEAIVDLCEGQDVWRCLGDAAGTDWGDLGDGAHPEWRELKVGLTDADLATGLPGLASASSGFFGTTEFAANDPGFAEFEAWLANLAGPSRSGDPDAASTLATRPGTYSAAGSLDALVSPVADRGVQAVAPELSVTATIAAVELAGGDGLPDTDGVQAALVAAGWASASDDDLAPTLKPGVMAALHTLWRDVTS